MVVSHLPKHTSCISVVPDVVTDKVEVTLIATEPVSVDVIEVVVVTDVVMLLLL